MINRYLLEKYDNPEIYSEIYKNDVLPNLEKFNDEAEILDRNKIAWIRCFDCHAVKPSFFMALISNANNGECIRCRQKRLNDNNKAKDKMMRELGFSTGISGVVYELKMTPTTSLIVENDASDNMWYFYKLRYFKGKSSHHTYMRASSFAEVLFKVESFVQWLEREREKNGDDYYKSKNLQRKRF